MQTSTVPSAELSHARALAQPCVEKPCRWLWLHGCRGSAQDGLESRMHMELRKDPNNLVTDKQP